MRDSIHSILRSAALLLLVGVIFLGCSEAPTAPLPEASGGVAGLSKHVPLTTGQATLAPRNQSGVSGRINFTDDGATLTIDGTATGLTPGIPYASLIYDNGSSPGGAEACEPTIFDPADPDFLLPTMFVGIWVNNGDGTGTLAAVNIDNAATRNPNDRVYVPLSKFKVMSIRDLTINGGFGPAAVAACGEEATHGQ